MRGDPQPPAAPEIRTGAKYLCKMPGDGRWEIRRTAWGTVAVSKEHGLYRLELTADGSDLKGEWVKVVV